MIKAIATMGTTTATAIFPPGDRPFGDRPLFVVVVRGALVVVAALAGAVEDEVLDTDGEVIVGGPMGAGGGSVDVTTIICTDVFSEFDLVMTEVIILGCG